MKIHTILGAGALLTLLPMTASAATLTIDLDQQPTGGGTIDLTAQGTLDWMSLGDAGATTPTATKDFVAQKAGANFIQTVTVVNLDGISTDWVGDDYASSPWASTWTDGDSANQTALAGSLEAKSGSVDADKVGLMFDVNVATAGDYQLIIYGTSYRSNYQLTASLDGTDYLSDVGAQNSESVFTIDFTTTAANETLSILYAQTADGGGSADNVGIAAITLAAVPEPSSTALLGLGGLSLILRRRK
ncbi:PEP-CTERM sorting domain-containing protein [Rubritalea spongiae]|uniref:PEP-CTERM sorting domain-containing protein n=1 Tax=Rubritalea spongiae TaxID=430797 RepID=A0ABW5E5M7_9BACT